MEDDNEGIYLLKGIEDERRKLYMVKFIPRDTWVTLQYNEKRNFCYVKFQPNIYVGDRGLRNMAEKAGEFRTLLKIERVEITVK